MSDIFYDRRKNPYRKVSELSPEQLEQRREGGRRRSKRYYSRQKSIYGKTHRERGTRPPIMGVCNHGNCQEVMMPPPICGMCLQGLCDHD